MPQSVLLTGVTGFIAKRIALDLLEAGYTVRGSLRNASREAEVRAALGLHLSDGDLLKRLHFVELDLTSEDGWDAALAEVDALVHTASPFPMAQPRDEHQVIGPAVEGTRRALNAARKAGTRRVVLTSSMVAVMSRDMPSGEPLTEEDWTDPRHPSANAYVKSKTAAERAAWKIAAGAPDMELVVINPGLVVGTPLDEHYGTSLAVIERLLAAKDPAQPDIGFPVVDLRDVSALHVAALSRDEMVGYRHLAAESFWTMPQLAALFAERYPDRGIATRVAPKPLLRLVGLFDRSVASIVPLVGRRYDIDTGPTRARAGWDFIPARDALLASAAYLTHQD